MGNYTPYSYIWQILAEDSPCDQCPKWDWCGKNELACEQFHDWVLGRSWEHLPRRPTRDMYHEVYKEPRQYNKK